MHSLLKGCAHHAATRRLAQARRASEPSRLSRAKRDLYGDSSTEPKAKRDQALALLFHRSGWTQEQIAKKEGRNQQWASRRLLFGRFLNFVPTGTNAENAPNNLTEWRFRSYWEQTDKGDKRPARSE